MITSGEYPPPPRRVERPAVDFEAIYRQVDEEFACDHVGVALRVKVASNGARYFRRQCLRCGKNVGMVSVAELSPAQQRSAAAVDEDSQSRWWASRSARQQELRQRAEDELASREAADNEEFDRWYAGYLNSPQWRSKRALVFTRSQGMCEGCGRREAVQVHHLTYARVGREMLFDLAAVCMECHRAIHPDKGRANR